jgi:hypothetical protein
VLWQRCCGSGVIPQAVLYHIRSVPSLSTIEMSPGCEQLLVQFEREETAYVRKPCSRFGLVSTCVLVLAGVNRTRLSFPFPHHPR